MSDLDRYDVERIINDAPEISRLRRDIQDLQREVEMLRQDLGAERVDRQDADESITRMVNSRTEHLV